MDIEGLGVAVVQQLLEKKLVKDIGDLYTLKKEDLLGLDLFAAKKAEKLIQAIDQSRRQPLSRLLFGLGIPNVGEKAAYTIAREFGDLEAIQKTKAYHFEQVPDVGPVMAQSLAAFFKHPATRELIAKLKKAGLNFTEEKKKAGTGPLSGKKFVFTGELTSMTRQEAGEAIRNLGGEETSSVSSKTDFVVVGDAPGSKYKKARSLGVPILDEQQFQEMIHATH